MELENALGQQHSVKSMEIVIILSDNLWNQTALGQFNLLFKLHFHPLQRIFDTNSILLLIRGSLVSQKFFHYFNQVFVVFFLLILMVRE